MDPGQQKRERCLMCPTKLKAHQTTYCSKTCARRRIQQKKRARDRELGRPDYTAFRRSVRDPVSLSVAEGIGLTVEELRRFAQEEIDRGNLIGFYRDGDLRLFGRPLAEGELPLYIENQRKLTQAERHRERVERERVHRERHREQRRRKRRNRAARRAAGG